MTGFRAPASDDLDTESTHIVGVCGAATSGLACLLAARGMLVSGSDQSHAAVCARLERLGIQVRIPHGEENLDPLVGEVVYSAAVPGSNPELNAARRMGIPIRKYAEALGRLVDDRQGIAVAGTHGKTTTAGMLASIFIAAGRDPSVLIGGEHPRLGGNWRCGRGAEFIAEACEFDRSFHHLHPVAGIITNLELDHPDIYRDETALLESFQVFLEGFRRPGLLLLPKGLPLAARLLAPAGVRVVHFGLGADHDWEARPLALGKRARFLALRRGDPWGEIELLVPGEHNILNALGALALAAELGVARQAIQAGLADFPGIQRRFQILDAVGGVELVEDYAHHPTEVESTLRTAREVFPKRRLWAVFQAHQYVRLNAFQDGFARALALADEVVLLPVFSVRERVDRESDRLLETLEKNIRGRGTPVRRTQTLDEGVHCMSRELSETDVSLSIGAGDVYRFTQGLQQQLATRRRGS